MSLLNDALRKKHEEMNSPEVHPLAMEMPGTAETDSKKKYYVVLALFLSLSVAAFGIWRFYIQPVFFSNETILTKSFSEEQTLKKNPSEENVQSNGTDVSLKTTTPSSKTEEVKPAPEKAQNSISEKTIEDKPAEPNRNLIVKKKKTDSSVSEFQEKKPLKSKTSIKKRKKIPEKKPSSPPAVSKMDTLFYKKAVGYHKSNDLEKSIQMYEEIVSKNPTFDAAQFNLAAAYIQKSMFNKARPILTQLLESDPENSQILLNLAIVEIGLNNPDKAITYLKLAESKQDQPDFGIYFHRGIANSKINNLNEAVQWYNKAKSIEPQNPNLLFNLGIVYERLKEYNHAVNHYEQSLQYGESFPPNQRHHIETRIRTIKRFIVSQ